MDNRRTTGSLAFWVWRGTGTEAGMTGDLHVPVSLGLPKPLSCRFMEASLAGVRSKIDRANKHFDEVNAAVEIALGAEDKANLTPPYEYSSLSLPAQSLDQLIQRCRSLSVTASIISVRLWII
jgi:hypothetical protein